MNNMWSKLRNWRNTLHMTGILVFIIVTRTYNLFRDVSGEEGIFVQPGRNFFLGKGYLLYLGETLGVQDFLCNPFHKPPLTSLASGLLSLLYADPIVGARLLPFSIGLWVVFLPFLLTRSWVPSWVLAMSPFFFQLSGQVQTDPTFGLLGYSLVAMGIWKEFDGDSRASRTWGIGLLILYLSKLELAGQTTALLVIASALKPRGQKVAFGFKVARWVLASIAFYVCLTGLLALTTDYSVWGAIWHAPSEIHRIMTSLSVHASDVWARRQSLWESFCSIKGQWLIAIFLVPLCARSPIRSSRAILMLLAAGMPFIVFFRSAYLGDRFPRYFAVIFPPLAILAGYTLTSIHGNFRRWIAGAMICVAVATSSKELGRLVREKGSIASGFGGYGYRTEAYLLQYYTKPGDLIVAAEPYVLYLPQRKLVVSEVLDPYPERYPAVSRLVSTVKAGLFAKTKNFDGPMAAIRKSLEDRGALSVDLPRAMLLYIPTKIQ